MTEEVERIRLTLPKSYVVVTEEHLIRQSEEGEPIARHQLSEISRVEARQVFNPIAVAFFAVGAGLAYFSYQEIGAEILKWILIALGAVLVLFALVGTFSSVLVVHLRGQKVKYSVGDEHDNLQGFATSLNEILGYKKPF